MSNVMNPDGTHKIIAGYSHHAGLQERDKRISELEATEGVLVVALEMQNSKLAKLEAAMVVIEQWAVARGRFISVEAFRERMQHGVVLAEEAS